MRRDRTVLWAFMSLLVLTSLPAAGGEADVVAVDVKRERAGTYRFDVTVRHADDGWKHYADRWDVLAPDGTILGTRVLLHPHVNEQPFKRSLSGVAIPDGIRQATIRAGDSKHGYGGAAVDVAVPGR